VWVYDSQGSFSSSIGIAFAKDASVENNLEYLGSSNQWNVNFAREAHDWKVDVFASFFRVLHSIIVRRGGEDKLWWVPFKKCLFKVKSFFHSSARSIGTCFPWKCVADPSSFKGSLFLWSANLGKILTLDNLRKRHVIMINRYCMCKKTEDSMDHLLLHCSILFSVTLGCLGFCHDGLSICLLIGGHRVGREVLWCEKWRLLAFFDAHGGK
jgi:hypothetical protein